MRATPPGNRPARSAETLSHSLWAHRHWLLLLLVANLLDIATTVIGLTLGIPEGNPVEASILASLGEFWMFLFKVMLVALLVLAIHPLHRHYRRLWPAFLVMTMPTVLVVLSNVALIAQVLG
ncbi:MAG TPA: DUF5658 family protein [Chloroflexota bacterium]|nr:DUF5658 family protein [Chloroflexota bacterium]